MRFLRYILFYALLLSCGRPCWAVGALITQDSNAYEITTPWLAEDLFEIQYCQSADIMYLVHQDYPPQQLSRLGETDWTLAAVDFTGGPFMDENKTESNTITPSAKTGAITLTANFDCFEAGHVGALWRINHLVDANSIGYFFVGTGSSATLEVQKGREYQLTTTYSWQAKIKLERSYDGGSTWQDASPEWRWDSNYGGNINYQDVETVANALYRVTCTEFYGGVCYYSFTAQAGIFGGIVQITSFDDDRHVHATVETDYDLADTSATFRWSEGSWSPKNGYPGAVTFFQERLAFAGSPAEPQTIWLSQTDDWTNFEYEDLATGALSFELAADQVNAIQWIAGHKSAVVMGTTGGEWKLDGGSEKSLTFESYDASRQSTYGSARIQPQIANSQIIYAQREAEKIRRMSYDFGSDSWLSPDLSIMAEHITGQGIVEMDYQRIPQPTLWSVRDDGQLLGVTFEENEDVIGWFRYLTDGEFESIAVIPGPEEDQLWTVVKRTIGGVDYRYVEQFQPILWDLQPDGFYVDCGLTFDGGSVKTVSYITQADPAVLTVASHGFSDGQQVRIWGVSGMTELNGNVYTVSTVTGPTFELRDMSDAVDINSVDFTAYSSGGYIEQVENTFTTLGHLEGETVIVAGDGGYAGSYTVSSGSITLSDYYNKVHAGLQYTAKLQPMPLEFQTTGGTLQGLRKKINATQLRFDRTLSASIGPTWTDYDRFVFRRTTDPLDAVTPIFTGDIRMLFDGPTDRQGNICLQDAFPVPLTVAGIITEYEAASN